MYRYRMLMNIEKTEDATEEAFCKMYTALLKRRKDLMAHSKNPFNFGDYLYKITKNGCLYRIKITKKIKPIHPIDNIVAHKANHRKGA